VFAPTKAAQRILAQSIAREVGPKGMHVAYAVIDAVIDVPWTRQAFAGRPDDFFIQPRAIAEEICRSRTRIASPGRSTSSCGRSARLVTADRLALSIFRSVRSAATGTAKGFGFRPGGGVDGQPGLR